jgi:RimJ/RimL family protein N-acetyltransferase
MSDQPELFELQPHLVGELIEVRPLAVDDWEALFAVASDPLIWEQHPVRERYREEVFREFFREALETGSAFVVIERKTGKIIGSSRYYLFDQRRFDPQESSVEIGWTFLARAFWGGEYNRELKRLMLDHAFKFVERVVFVIGVTNFRSQKALEKIGGVRVGRRDKADAQGNVVENFVYEIRRTGGAA